MEWVSLLSKTYLRLDIIELPVSLVIGDVSFFGLLHNIQLKQNIFTDGNISIGRKQSFNEINVK